MGMGQLSLKGTNTLCSQLMIANREQASFLSPDTPTSNPFIQSQPISPAKYYFPFNDSISAYQEDEPNVKPCISYRWCSHVCGWITVNTIWSYPESGPIHVHQLITIHLNKCFSHLLFLSCLPFFPPAHRCKWLWNTLKGYPFQTSPRLPLVLTKFFHLAHSERRKVQGLEQGFVASTNKH